MHNHNYKTLVLALSMMVVVVGVLAVGVSAQYLQAANAQQQPQLAVQDGEYQTVEASKRGGNTGTSGSSSPNNRNLYNYYNNYNNRLLTSARKMFKTPTVDQDDLDYYGVVLANLLASNRQILPDKRSCIRRNGPCDHRPNDCCPKSSCRCNLWGTNCRCQRLGLFQKWGKKR